MPAIEFIKELIYIFEDVYRIDFFIEEDIEDNEFLSEYDFNTELIINPVISLELPLDVTQLILGVSRTHGIDPDNLIEDLSLIKIEPIELGFTSRLDLISLSFEIDEDSGKYTLISIELL